MEKLKERLDMLSDAIIAIIITIMVLELPVSVHNGVVDYGQLARSIGIYMVSFCFVANIWYQHAMAFNQVEKVRNRIIVLDLILLMFLSLMPTFTKLMTTDTVRSTVMLYGGLYLVITLLLRYIVESIVHQKYTDKNDMRKVYTSIYGARPDYLSLLLVVMIIVSYFFPRIISVLYIIIPIRSFIANSLDREEFDQISQMKAEGRTAYLQMDNHDKIRFSRMLRQYSKRSRHLGDNRDAQQANWEQFSQRAQQQFNISDTQLRQWMRQYRDEQQESRGGRDKGRATK